MQIVMYFHMQNIPSYLTVQSCWPNLFHCLQMELVFELACISMHTVLHDAQRDREIELSWFPDHSHLQPLITCIFAYCNWSKTWGRNVLRTRLKLSIIPWNNLSACDSWLLNQYCFQKNTSALNWKCKIFQQVYDYTPIRTHAIQLHYSIHSWWNVKKL